jgi:hypothetical protein
MALRIKYRGHSNTLASLETAAYTRANFGNMPGGRTSTTITADTPDGELGGMVAKVTGDYEVGIFDGQGQPAGLFVNDAVGSAYENTPAVASGKSPYMMSMGSYEINVYETELENGNPFGAPYAAGDKLYASNFGLVTKENTGSGVIGYVTKAPSTNDPWMGLNLLI